MLRASVFSLCALFALTGMNCTTGPSRVTIAVAARAVTTAGTVAIEVIDAGGLSIDRMEFHRNGRKVVDPDCPRGATPSTCSWLVTEADNGTHRWQAILHDAAGNTWPSNVLQLEVDIRAQTEGPRPRTGGGCPVVTGFVQSAGTARDVVMKTATLDGQSRTLAYVTSDEMALSIFDVTNSAAPVALGALVPSLHGSAVAVGGSLAVVGAGSDGLHVIDVSNPRLPVMLGHYDAHVTGVAVSGSYAYARVTVPGNPAHTDLVVLDLRTPSEPTLLTQVFASSGSEVQVQASRAYITDAGALRIFDISNPAAPSELGSEAIPDGARELAVSGSVAYVGNLTAIHSVNIANAANPTRVGSVNVATLGLTASGNRLYSVGGGLKVIDVSNLASPAVLSTVDDRYSQGAAVLGSLLAITSPEVDAADDQGGLYLFNVAGSTPTLASHVPASPGTNKGVAVSGTLAVTANGQAGMHVVDVSDPTRPQPVGWLDMNAQGVAMSGGFAYVRVAIPGNPGHTDIAVVDLRTPSAPVLLDQVFAAGGSSIAVDGGRVYVGVGGELEIYAIQQPWGLTRLGAVTVPGGTNELAVSGNHAYLGNYSQIHVVDVSSPSNPFVVGSVSGLTFGLAYAEDYLYSVGGGLRVIDVSDPGAPTVVANVGDSGAMGVGVIGDFAFVASPSEGDVFAFDVSVPTAPVFLYEMGVPGPAREVTTTTDTVYVGDDTSLVDIIQF